MMKKNQRWLTIGLWIACQFLAISLLLPMPVSADDCLTDPLNAADCMRTPGFRPAISIIISVGGTLATILVNVLSGTAAATGGAVTGAATGAATAGPSPATGPTSGPSPIPVTPIPHVPWLNGGPWNNPNTEFNGGKGPARCSRNGLPNYWVNTATLNLYVEDVVYSYTSLGPDIELALSYNAAPGSAGMFGRAWHFSYDSLLQQLPERIVIWKGSGQQISFQNAPSRGPQPPNAPSELVLVEGNRERLFDYGTFFLLLEADTHLSYRYDKLPGTAWGHLTAISDSNENVVQLTYNPDGTLRAVTDASGRATTFGYDATLRCIGFSLPDGRQAKYAYDGQGNLVQAIDLLGTVTRYEYDADGSLARMIVDRDQKTTTFTYQTGPQGKLLTAVTDPAGHVTRYALISMTPRQVQITDPEGNATTYHSTPQGYTERVVDPTGASRTFGYDRGLRVSIQDRNGQLSKMTYDARGNLIAQTDPLGHVTTWTYDAYNNVISEKNALGETTTYTYDGRHALIRTTYPSGDVEINDYDARGQRVGLTKVKGDKTVFAYDRFGNLAAVTTPLGYTKKYTYDSYGMHCTAVTDAQGNTTGYEYDAHDRLIGVINPDGTRRAYAYDCCAGIASVDEAGQKAVSRRDALLSVTEKVDALQNAQMFVYDRVMRLVKIQDPLGRAWTLAYDPDGHMVQWTHPTGASGRLAYDPEGNMTALWDENGKKTDFAYDANHRLIRTTDALGHSVAFTRDALGRIAATTNARGSTVNVDYGPAGKVIAKRYNAVQIATYEYDALENLVQMNNAGGTTRYEYNSVNAVTAIHYPDALQVTYTYDLNGNPVRITYPGEQTVNYTYDTRNRVTHIAWGPHSLSFRYDAVGNLTGVTRSNGTQTTYTYDAARRIVGVTHQAGAAAFAQLIYTRDKVGNIVNESGMLPVQPALDAASVPVTYNEIHQIVQRDGQDYTYDADGNLIGIGTGTWQAAYDAENRPVEIVREGRSRRFTYNALGQRSLVDSGTQRRSYHDDIEGRLLFETDQNGTLVAWYLYRDAYVVARIDAMGNVLFYHFDKTGNTLALTDPTGTVVAAYGYTPQGLITGKLGEIDQPFTYVGECGVMDEGDGLFYMRNRIYDAATGRFLQKDPLGFMGETNPYTYAGNNPIRYVDPAGFWGLDLADWKFWVGGAMTTLGGAMLLAPTGFTEVMGGSAIKVGTGLMVAGGTLEVVSVVTADPEAAKAKAQAAVDAANKQSLVQGADGKWKIDPDLEYLYPPGSKGRKNLETTMGRLNSTPCKP